LAGVLAGVLEGEAVTFLVGDFLVGDFFPLVFTMAETLVNRITIKKPMIPTYKVLCV
jgi:hypothetical protein